MNKKTLILSFIAGLSVNALLAAMTQSAVSLSLFVPLTLGLACYILYQDWVAGVNADSSGWPAVGVFVTGLLTYSVVLRAQYPEVGNVIFPVLILCSLACWGAYKFMIEPQQDQDAESDS